VYRDTDHAAQLAAAQGIGSADLLRHGIVDAVVAERPDAADEPIDFVKRLSRAIAGELGRLRTESSPQRYASRLARYRRLGLPPDMPSP
jgi:acetyl-CoA carboxylase alpha subunit